MFCFVVVFPGFFVCLGLVLGGHRSREIACHETPRQHKLILLSKWPMVNGYLLNGISGCELPNEPVYKQPG